MAATVALLDGVGCYLMTSSGVFQDHLGSMTLDFPPIFFFFVFLRFEATVGFPLLGAELEEVVERFVKGARVGSLVAKV